MWWNVESDVLSWNYMCKVRQPSLSLCTVIDPKFLTDFSLMTVYNFQSNLKSLNIPIFAELRFYEIFRSHFWWDIITLPAVLIKYMWNWSSTRCDWLRGVYHHLRTVAVDYGIGNISPSWMDYIRWDKSDICKKSVILTRKEWYLQGKYIWIPWYDRTRMAILMCYFLMLLMCLTKNVKNVILKKNICYWIAYILYDPVGRNLTICNKNGNDIKNNAWVTVSNDFLVTSEVICQWFSRVMKSPVKIIGKSPHDWQKNHYSR